MTSSELEEQQFPEPRTVTFDEGNFWVGLADGRVIGVPLAWYPRLLGANREQLKKVEMSPSGLHWDELDEDISIKGIVLGYKSFEFRPADAA